MDTIGLTFYELLVIIAAVVSGAVTARYFMRDHEKRICAMEGSIVGGKLCGEQRENCERLRLAETKLLTHKIDALCEATREQGKDIRELAEKIHVISEQLVVMAKENQRRREEFSKDV